METPDEAKDDKPDEAIDARDGGPSGSRDSRSWRSAACWLGEASPAMKPEEVKDAAEEPGVELPARQ